MLALPHVSGTECIDILKVQGYRLVKRAGGLASLLRGANEVIVPESATLSPPLVAAICRAANVDPLDFIRVLDARGEPPTERVA
jgi:predicted RNA binding protein YcfA (HicA-like mRNA interferase family)